MDRFGLVLALELVPESAKKKNLRYLLSEEEWDRIRWEVYRRAGRKCEICGKENTKLECHEQWYYDDESLIQRLIGLQALCSLCHAVKHFDIPGDEDGCRMEHFMEVNDWRDSDAITRYMRQEIDDFEERSCHDWELNIDWLEIWEKKYEFRVRPKTAQEMLRSL
jgi:hypothetical protein